MGKRTGNLQTARAVLHVGLSLVLAVILLLGASSCSSRARAARGTPFRKSNQVSRSAPLLKMESHPGVISECGADLPAGEMNAPITGDTESPAGGRMCAVDVPVYTVGVPVPGAYGPDVLARGRPPPVAALRGAPTGDSQGAAYDVKFIVLLSVAILAAVGTLYRLNADLLKILVRGSERRSQRTLKNLSKISGELTKELHHMKQERQDLAKRLRELQSRMSDLPESRGVENFDKWTPTFWKLN